MTSRRASTGELPGDAPDDAPGAEETRGAARAAAASDDDDDPGLSAMRAVWLTMRDEAPPDRGLAALLAMARHKAEVMRPPSLWQRLVAMMRRPPVLALATALVLIGGAVLIGRRLPDELSVPRPPAVSGDPAGASRAGVAVPPRGETGSGQAVEQRRAPGAGPGPLEEPTDQPGNAASAPPGVPGGDADGDGDRLARGGVGAVAPAAQDAPHPSPEAELAALRHAKAMDATMPDATTMQPAAPALRSAERPSARDAVERLAPPMPRARPRAPGAAPGAPGTPKDDGLTVGRDATGSTAERAGLRRGASPAPVVRHGTAANTTGESAPSLTADIAGSAGKADGRTGTGASSAGSAPAADAARAENAEAKADDAPARSGPTAPMTRGAASREALAALYKQSEAAAQRGDCAAVKRLAVQIARTDRGYRARVGKDGAVAKCLAE